MTDRVATKVCAQTSFLLFSLLVSGLSSRVCPYDPSTWVLFCLSEFSHGCLSGGPRACLSPSLLHLPYFFFPPDLVLAPRVTSGVRFSVDQGLWGSLSLRLHGRFFLPLLPPSTAHLCGCGHTCVCISASACLCLPEGPTSPSSS